MSHWYEYILITGASLQCGEAPQDHDIDIEAGDVLIDTSFVGNNDDPVQQDTWIFTDFLFVPTAPHTRDEPCMMLAFEAGHSSIIEVVMKDYGQLSRLFAEHEETIGIMPERPFATLLTRWLCSAQRNFDPYTHSYENDIKWQLDGKVELLRQGVTQ